MVAASGAISRDGSARMNAFVLKNPFDGSVLREIPFTSEADTFAALEAVKAGRRTQAALAAFERAEILTKLAKLLDANREEIVKLIVAEVGKTARDSRTEVLRAIQTVTASAEEARRIEGEVMDTDAYPPKRRKRAIVEWRPLGVVLAITPFNFPVNISAHKLAPAFAAGDTILFKPAPHGHAAAARFVELAYEAGVPRDVLRLVMPDVPTIQKLVAHPDVACVNFTGSVPVGLELAKIAGMKRTLMELGGNDPLIVMADADLDAAVEVAVEQRFGTAGQRCTAVKRVYVHPSVKDAFLSKLVLRTKKLVVGDPALEATDVGPVVDARSADRVMEAIAAAVSAGAKVLAGNERAGNVIHPTILADVPPDAPMAKIEVFGPVIPVWTFDSVDRLVEMVNAQPFGLQAGLFTNDLALAQRLFEALDVGALAVNGGPGFRAEHIPFGGVKESGLGREGVKYAIREMSYRKTFIL